MLGPRGFWASQGFKVQTISSTVFSGRLLQCLTFTWFWENVLTITCWIPGVALQIAKTEVSVKCTSASQTGVLLPPLWSHYRILWHMASNWHLNRSVFYNRRDLWPQTLERMVISRSPCTSTLLPIALNREEINQSSFLWNTYRSNFQETMWKLNTSRHWTEATFPRMLKCSENHRGGPFLKDLLSFVIKVSALADFLLHAGKSPWNLGLFPQPTVIFID